MNKFWLNDLEIPKFKALDRDIKTNTVIIGGGIAGIMTAYYLNKLNIPNVIVEANKICSGQTQNTTAKITSQHKLIYSELTKIYGKEKTSQYARANTAAIDEFEKIINENQIDCDFKRLPSYLYTNVNKQRLEDEYNCAHSLYIDCKLCKPYDLPFKSELALRFENQAQFNPLKFLYTLSKNLNIYENSAVTLIENNGVICNDHKITSENTVFCSHFPFINIPGFYFAKMHQNQSFVVAIDKLFNINGIYYGIDNGDLSIREYKNSTIFTGENKRTGFNSIKNPFYDIENKISEFTDNYSVTAKWFAQDCITNDLLPYIGRFSLSKTNCFIASGFNKWGMTSSLISGMVISSLISNNKNPFPVFSPLRLSPPKTYKNYLYNFGIFGKQFTKKYFTSSSKTDSLKPGESAVINYNGKKIGVYKDNSNIIYTVNLKCPHAGCMLEWNKHLLSWDCPCHGSRFSYDGKLLDNPANKNISIDTDISFNL